MKNKVKIFYYHPGEQEMDGTLISVVDLYYNLRNFIDVEFIIIADSIGRIARIFTSNGFKDLFDKVQMERYIECDILLCSYSTIVRSRYITNDIVFNCNNIIALDSLDYTQIRYGLMPKPKIDFTLLGNPNNINYPIENVIKAYEYYHKFDFVRVSGLKLPEIYFYNRSKKEKIHCGEGTYIENIGKLIFENLYLGNTVFYRKNGLVDEDGLCHYLRLFDIDPFLDHTPLRISKERIVEKLSFKEDDLILKLIGE